MAGYEAQFSLDEVFTDEDETIVRTATETSYRRLSLPPGASRFLRVRSFSGTGEARLWSEWSHSIAGMTSGAAAPETPTNLHVSRAGESYIEWKWNPVEEVDGYRIQYSLDDESFTESDKIVERPAIEHSYRVADLSPAVTVSLRVQSFVGGGTDRVQSAWSASVSGSTPAAPVRRHDGEFTDSQGRSVRYRLFLDGAWNTSEPRGLMIHLHGNTAGTQQELLDTFGRVLPRDARGAGLAYAVVTSPKSRGGVGRPLGLLGWLENAGGVREWLPEDSRLIHELLQSGFNSTLTVDHDAVVFQGASQGTVFLTSFFEQYAGIYGGGFHARCGGVTNLGEPLARVFGVTEWEPLFSWTPASSAFVRERFRIFVEATTGDFLHARAVQTAQYYADTLGLAVRSDLDSPGGHCAFGTVSGAQIVDWLSFGGRQTRTRVRREDDVDADGIGNLADEDDDGDGALDFIDAFPLEPREWRDTDGDGVGDFMDRDADGDGVDNASDPFSLNAREWRDTDGDGVGDNLDDDDDNDGIPDERDRDPSGGATEPSLVFTKTDQHAFDFRAHSAQRQSRRPSGAVYPQPQGDRQSYRILELGDGERVAFHIMVDRFDRTAGCDTTLLAGLCDSNGTNGYWESHLDMIYVDRNANRDLTDDGPPLVLGQSFNSGRPAVSTEVTVSYASGEELPYWLRLWTTGNLDVYYRAASVWTGVTQDPSGNSILAATIDRNVDGMFDSVGSTEHDTDIVCLDLDRNGALDECGWDFDRQTRPRALAPRQRVVLDGREYRIAVSPSGRVVQFESAR